LPETLDQLIQSGAEVRSFPVHHIHEDKAADAILFAGVPEALVLNLQTDGRINNDYRSLNDSE